MLKVLVADKNLETNLDCCQYLTNDKTLDVISASSGISVLNKYHETHPNILVINSDFEDKSYTEIINEISTTSEERNNSNIILTIENSYEKLELDYAAKLYKLFYFPIDYKKIKNGIEQYNLDKFIFFEPTDENLTALFYKLNLYNDFLGAEYYRFAIQECYKNPKLMKSLKNIFEEVSKEFHVSYNSVRPAMRSALNSVKNYRTIHGNKGFLKIFEDEETLTPKNFIQDITKHYLKQKNKK